MTDPLRSEKDLHVVQDPPTTEIAMTS